MALQKGLIELLLKKPLREITISEVTDAANVSRTTFYLHYRNINELFERMENDIYLQFVQIIHQSMADEQNLLHVVFDEHEVPTMPALEEVCRFIYDNRDLSVVLLNNPDSTFLDKVWSAGHDVLIQRVSELESGMDIKQIEYYYIFVISGIRGIMEHWIASDLAEPVAQVVEITTSFVLRNMGFLLGGDTGSSRPKI